LDPDTSNNRFWKALAAVGREVLDQGKAMGFGMSIIEVKFANGEPMVMVRSHTQHLKYPTNNDAMIALNLELQQSQKAQYDGARTFTVVMHQGEIQRILLDEYQNTALK
jgi:hypothetical protein